MITFLISLVLAVAAGLLTGPDAVLWPGGITFVQLFDLVGRLFLNALTLMVVPLVASSVILGAARLGAEHSVGSLGKKTFGVFILTSVCAALIGTFLVIMIAPGEGYPAVTLSHAAREAIAQISGGGDFAKVEQIVLRIIPANIIAAASQGQMLGLIFFCLLFGYFLMKIDAAASEVMLRFWRALFQIMMKMTLFVMRALPLGIFALVAKVVALSGKEAFGAVLWFFVTACVALALYFFILLPFLLRTMARVSPMAHYRAMLPALLTAFSTSSSVATLPIALECTEERAGVSNRVCGFVLPLGSSVNLPGSTLYVCVVLFFIAQAYGIQLSVATQVIAVVMALLTSWGMAGIPSASLIAIVIILPILGLPAEGLSLVMPVDRLLDMLRTTTTVFANSCCAVMVARSEGEETYLQREPLKERGP